MEQGNNIVWNKGITLCGPKAAQTKVNNKANVLTAELDTQLVQGVQALTPREIGVPREGGPRWQSNFESDNPRRTLFWWQSMLELDLCNHGRPIRFIPESGHAVSKFIEAVTHAQCFDDLDYHQEVFDNDIFRKLSIHTCENWNSCYHPP